MDIEQRGSCHVRQGFMSHTGLLWGSRTRTIPWRWGAGTLGLSFLIGTKISMQIWYLKIVLPHPIVHLGLLWR